MNKTQMQIYNEIYEKAKEAYIDGGQTLDKASRLANMYAVKNTRSTYEIYIKGLKNG